MAPNIVEYPPNASPEQIDRWRSEIEDQCGMTCISAPRKNSTSWSRGWRIGKVGALDARVSAQTWAPLFQGKRSVNENGMFVKIVTRGSVVVSQNNEELKISAGGIMTVDPAWPFEEHFLTGTRIIALKLPRAELKARGYPYGLRRIIVADVLLPDVSFFRDFLIRIADKKELLSDTFRVRLGEQILDMINILLQNTDAYQPARHSDLTVLRAKGVIARRLGDSQLDIVQIASELNVSTSYLSKLFRAEGTTVMRYVLQKRLDRAHNLLKQYVPPRAQIQEIAYTCGFESPSHFSRAFKERFGFPPRDATDN